jgi:hypothetical protein
MDTLRTPTQAPGSGVLQHLFQWLIAYIAWTQRVPMLVAWSGGLFVLAALIFVVTIEQSQSVTEQMIALLERSPRLQDWLASFAGQPGVDGNETNSLPEHFQRWVFIAWSVLALVLAALGALAGALGFTLPKASLRTRLLIAASCSAALAVVFLLVIVTSRSLFHGSLLGWSVLYLGLPAAVLVFTSYSVFVAHYLGRLALALAGAPRT